MDQLINQDNKSYRFSPGKNGSLTASSNSTNTDSTIGSKPHISRVVPALKNMRKRKMDAVQVASARG